MFKDERLMHSYTVNGFLIESGLFTVYTIHKLLKDLEPRMSKLVLPCNKMDWLPKKVTSYEQEKNLASKRSRSSLLKVVCGLFQAHRLGLLSFEVWFFTLSWLFYIRFANYKKVIRGKKPDLSRQKSKSIHLKKSTNHLSQRRSWTFLRRFFSF